MPSSQAKAVLVAEPRRSLGLWSGYAGTDPAPHEQSPERPGTAAGPLAIISPGHLLPAPRRRHLEWPRRHGPDRVSWRQSGWGRRLVLAPA